MPSLFDKFQEIVAQDGDEIPSNVYGQALGVNSTAPANSGIFNTGPRPGAYTVNMGIGPEAVFNTDNMVNLPVPVGNVIVQILQIMWLTVPIVH